MIYVLMGSSVLAITMLLSSEPLFMCVSLVVLATAAGLILCALSSKWLGLSLILVFAGGMMVMFIYISSVGSHVKLKKKYNMMSLTVVIFAGAQALPATAAVFQLSPPSSNLSASLGPWLAVLTLALLSALMVVIKLARGFEGSLLGQ